MSNLDAPYRPGWSGYLAAGLCGGLIWFGLRLRPEQLIRAEEGLGYGLGVAGAAAMLLLLGYSARKRARRLSEWGPLSTWFRIHMFLGVAGPIAILFHANFRLGSQNANVALASMLLVAGSGLIGRFIYGQIHYGVYGRRIALAELHTRLTETEGTARPLLEAFPEVVARLEEFASIHTSAPSGSLAALWRLISIGGRGAALQREVRAMLDPALAEERAAAGEYIARLRQLARFSAYERLFRLWHAIHVPLFVILILTAVLHVVAVHMF